MHVVLLLLLQSCSVTDRGTLSHLVYRQSVVVCVSVCLRQFLTVEFCEARRRLMLDRFPFNLMPTSSPCCCCCLSLLRKKTERRKHSAKHTILLWCSCCTQMLFWERGVCSGPVARLPLLPRLDDQPSRTSPLVSRFLRNGPLLLPHQLKRRREKDALEQKRVISGRNTTTRTSFCFTRARTQDYSCSLPTLASITDCTSISPKPLWAAGR